MISIVAVWINTDNMEIALGALSLVMLTTGYIFGKK